MKLKGISIIEQHVEKIVLLVFALFAIGVFVMQFDIMGDPNAVKIDNEKVPPDKAVDIVSKKALRLKGQMEGEGEGIEIPDQSGPLKLVESALKAPVSTIDKSLQLAAATSKGYEGPAPTPGPDITLGNAYYQITPPAPTQVMANAFAGTIDPFEPLMHPELATLLPAEQPFDKRAVTVQGTFDAASLRAMLGTAPEDESVNPLPNAWWQGRVELLDVELIRQETYEDGSMGPEETIGVMPGRFSLRDRIQSSDTAPKDLPEILRAEADHRAEIRRPDYYHMIMGEPWVWPAKAAESGAERPNAKDIARLVREYASSAREKERAEKALDAIGEFGPGSPAGRPGPTRGEVWPEIPSTWLAQILPPKPSGGGGGEDEGEKRREKQAKALRDKIEQLSKRMADIQKELRETYHVDVDGKPLESGAVSTFDEALTSLTGPDALDSVTVWAHDVTAEPGKSYRYKMRVWVTNPLFGHVADVPDAQRELAGHLGVASAESAWTDVVETYPERVFFVASAIEGSAGGSFGIARNASASVDAYEFYYGYWRGGSVSLDQGDRIRVALNLPELPIFEIEKNPQGEPVVKGTSNVASEMTISEDALLLEVGVGLGSGDRGQVHEAIFGWLDGRGLEVRVAESDAESPMADSVWSSSEASKTAEVGTPGLSGKADSRWGSPRPDDTPRDEPGTFSPSTRPGMLSPGK